MSALLLASFGIQAAILLFGWKIPTVYPKSIHGWLQSIISVFALAMTFFDYSIFPASGSVSPMWVAVALIALAMVSPLAGLITARFAANGQAVYFVGERKGMRTRWAEMKEKLSRRNANEERQAFSEKKNEPKSRFAPHIVSNISGALVASALYWLAYRTPGFENFVASFPNDAAFNVLLPVMTVVVLAFVRYQQTLICPNLDDRMREPDGKTQITGYSLRHFHQIANVVHLIVAAFIASASYLYLVAYAMRNAKAGHPLELSWGVILAITATLAFVCLLGTPRLRVDRSVYLTFLTGTPAALGGAIVWLLWLKHDVLRDSVAFSIVGIGYVTYCALLAWAHQDKEADASERQSTKFSWPPLHFFAPMAIAVVLSVLLATAYLS